MEENKYIVPWSSGQYVYPQHQKNGGMDWPSLSHGANRAAKKLVTHCNSDQGTRNLMLQWHDQVLEVVCIHSRRGLCKLLNWLCGYPCRISVISLLKGRMFGRGLNFCISLWLEAFVQVGLKIYTAFAFLPTFPRLASPCGLIGRGFGYVLRIMYTAVYSVYSWIWVS